MRNSALPCVCDVVFYCLENLQLLFPAFITEFYNFNKGTLKKSRENDNSEHLLEYKRVGKANKSEHLKTLFYDRISYSKEDLK